MNTIKTIKAEDIKIGDWYASQYMGKHAWPPGAEIQIVVPQLTPAQQNADEMLQLLKQHADPTRPPVPPATAQQLIDKIEPPQPVTLGEALRILETINIGGMKRDEVAGLMARARAAGQLDVS